MPARAPRRKPESRAPDAVRYVVLRKLAPALRHAMMGELQTVEFTADLCAAMLRKGHDTAVVLEQLEKLAAQTRAAAARCRGVTDLLRPAESSTLALGEVVRNSIKLAGADWSLRGVTATLHASDETASVLVPAMPGWELIVTSLLALVDVHASALDIVISAELRGDAVAVRIEVATPKRAGSVPLTQPREMLNWDDVTAIAGVHGVACTCNREAHAIELELPRVRESSGS
jgi:hypothetical protein